MPRPASVLPAAFATILVVAAAWAAARSTPPGTGDATAALGEAWAAYRIGDFPTALAAYHAAAEAAPRAVTPLLGVMYCEAARGDTAAALAAARAVLERDPVNPQALHHVARAAFDRGDFPAAEATCREMLATHPEDVEAGALLGWCLVRQAQAAEARDRFQAVLAVVPHHVSAREGLMAVGVADAAVPAETSP